MTDGNAEHEELTNDARDAAVLQKLTPKYEDSLTCAGVINKDIHQNVDLVRETLPKQSSVDEKHLLNLCDSFDKSLDYECTLVEPNILHNKILEQPVSPAGNTALFPKSGASKMQPCAINISTQPKAEPAFTSVDRDVIVLDEEPQFSSSTKKELSKHRDRVGPNRTTSPVFKRAKLANLSKDPEPAVIVLSDTNSKNNSPIVKPSPIIGSQANDYYDLSGWDDDLVVTPSNIDKVKTISLFPKLNSVAGSSKNLMKDGKVIVAESIKVEDIKNETKVKSVKKEGSNDSSESLSRPELELLEIRQKGSSLLQPDTTNVPDLVPTQSVPHLLIDLLPHQQAGVSWMKFQEESRSFHGGLLADDMGLGKTIQAISLILLSKSNRLDRQRTLIVTPLSLLPQWADELTNRVAEGQLRVTPYHRSLMTNKKRQNVDFKIADVVLTTYSTLASEFKNSTKASDDKPSPKKNKKDEAKSALCKPALVSPLFKISWNRIILDEAHTIKNRSTKVAKACLKLKAKHRWCLTGTPIQNSIDDLYSILAFLRVHPYTDWNHFKAVLCTKQDKEQPELNETFVNLLQMMSLRRTKYTKVNNIPILNLPERNIYIQEIELSAGETHFLQVMERVARNKLKLIKTDKGGLRGRSYVTVLTLILRLRQACIHPKLALESLKGPMEFLPEEMELNNTNNIDEEDDKKIGSELPPLLHCRYLEARQTGGQLQCALCSKLALVDDLSVYVPCGDLVCSHCAFAKRSTRSTLSTRCPKCSEKSTQALPQSLTDVFDRPDSGPNVEDGDGAIDLEAIFHEESLTNSSSKLTHLVNLITQLISEHPKDKIVLFTQFTKTLLPLLTPLLDQIPRLNYTTYTGELPIEKRHDIIKEFATAPKLKLLIVSLTVGSQGLNLIMANRVIFIDQWWNPAIENQAIDRVHRIGQSKPVSVYRLVVSRTIETRIVELQQRKQILFDRSFNNQTSGHQLTLPSLSTTRLRLDELESLFS